ncbi:MULTISPECIES: shikimate dehydrogenase [unclassified Bradyrhizobium]|uniref:shikimate dehydrogenase family protein n=1 Tax=unclassified Bradyrhizobium TaxID=2631580 RepID=UPI00247A5725|nr:MULTISPECIES: shikimate dehydrogenase [unclassified Bradyrhizobium]WGR72393.1 shikimate dehydrogenase [Bradyrhizobium sp. ISRA426]WGR77226.1 shikimate dehydrogenase [Bradyrhizobium sp. ISRA430]WGR87632.1 shikimate dehydrogenase [Bradyrhizobium sp. ISRA432]
MKLPTGASRVVFIFAHPAGHVGAPRYYTPYFGEQGLDWHMVPMDVTPKDLAETIRALAKSPSTAGFNLTMPHKPAAFELCDEVGPAAKFEGVVNTIRIEANGRLVGESFDGGGFLNAARQAGIFDPNRRCVVIGAGGAGRAICHALATAGLKRLRILNEAPGPVEALATRLRGQFPDLAIDLEERFDDAGLCVNATSLGLHATDALPMDPMRLPRDCAVFDIIAARRTEFMEASAARGLKVIDGVAMIRHQLPLQTAFWRGETSLRDR